MNTKEHIVIVVIADTLEDEKKLINLLDKGYEIMGQFGIHNRRFILRLPDKMKMYPEVETKELIQAIQGLQAGNLPPETKEKINQLIEAATQYAFYIHLGAPLREQDIKGELLKKAREEAMHQEATPLSHKFLSLYEQLMR